MSEQTTDPSEGARSSRGRVIRFERSVLAAQWRIRADRLDKYARTCRAEGDSREAEDAEQAATEYRVAADELEGA